jgi:hypothetical protein
MTRYVFKAVNGKSSAVPDLKPERSCVAWTPEVFD